jgi:hypothetical protein
LSAGLMRNEPQKTAPIGTGIGNNGGSKTFPAHEVNSKSPLSSGHSPQQNG